MPYVCITAELMQMPGWGVSYYSGIYCESGVDVWFWDLTGLPPGDCATASVDASCFYVLPDNPYKSKRLSDEQRAQIDKVSDLVAYQRMNEDEDNPKSDDKKNE